MEKARGRLLAIASAIVTAMFYGRAMGFDLQCDDLLMIRPWPRAELFAVWHGPWDPSGAFAVFFRPIGTWFYAATFELFGLNATSHMLLSLAMLAAVAWLLALFVAREMHSTVAGAVALVTYLSHPNVPWSTGTWVTNDFHKLTAISALCALLAWQRLRAGASSRWWWLAPFVVVCFLVKEDGLMLIPALLACQWLRARLVGDVKPASLPFVAGAMLFGLALVLWRYLALRQLGGFGVPSPADMFANLVRGPLYAFTLHGSLSVLTIAEKLTAILVAAIVALGIALMPREKRFLPLAGLALMFSYDLPLALISNVMRYYMLTIASVMVLTPICLAWSSQPIYKWVGAVPLLMLLGLNIGMRRQDVELNRFAPCNWAEHNCVSWVLDEVPTLPPEARAYVSDTNARCSAGMGSRPRIGDSGTLTWGLGATSIDTDSGEVSSEVTGDVVMLVRTNKPTTGVLVRHAAATADTPVVVDVYADGTHETRTLTSPNWLRFDVPMTNGLRSWLRGAHRVDVRFSVPGADWQRPN